MRVLRLFLGDRNHLRLWVLLLLGSSGFGLGSSGLSWDPLDSPGLSEAIMDSPGLPGLSWALLGSDGLDWDLLVSLLDRTGSPGCS